MDEDKSLNWRDNRAEGRLKSELRRKCTGEREGNVQVQMNFETIRSNRGEEKIGEIGGKRIKKMVLT